jgi:hypothetical protein
MSTVLSDGSYWYSVVSVESGSNLNGIVKSRPVRRRGSEGDGFEFELGLKTSEWLMKVEQSSHS